MAVKNGLPCQISVGDNSGDHRVVMLVKPTIALQCNTQQGNIMAANQLVQTRIDGAIKTEAAAVLAAMGLTVSDAVRLMLTKVAKEHALPFDPLIPNAKTIAAIKEARAEKLPRAKSMADLKAALNARD